MAALPQTYKAFRSAAGTGTRANPTPLELVTEDLPTSLKPNEVLIRIHAVSLNYRDVAMMHGLYPDRFTKPGVPASDCAAEVMALGREVSDFKVGDRVAPIFDLKNLEGIEEEREFLGGAIDGVLRQYAVFDQSVLLHLPEHLSWEEVCNPFIDIFPKKEGEKILVRE